LSTYPAGPGHDRIQQRPVVAERGEHQAGHPGQPRPDLPADRDPVAAGQPDIEHGHVRAQRRDPGPRGRGGAGLADHLDVRCGFQQPAHSAADDLLVI
jgi:hypothetical protein